MELLLDTADLKAIAQGIDVFPIVGVTTNPSILAKEGGVDFFEHLNKIKGLIGEGRSLHVQVVGSDALTMFDEAVRIREVLGKETFIKVPVDHEGLKAIRMMADEGFHVTATVIYTEFQGLLASMAGAEYLAVYYNRIKTQGEDPDTVVRNLSSPSVKAKVLTASLKTISQLTAAYAAGSEACTVGYELLCEGLGSFPIQKAVEDFRSSWKSIHGDNSILDL